MPRTAEPTFERGARSPSSATAPTVAGGVGRPALRRGGGDRLVEHAETLVQQALVDREGRQEPDHVVVGAGLEDHDAVRQTPLHDRRSRWRHRAVPSTRDRLTSSIAVIIPRPRTSPITSWRSLHLAQSRRDVLAERPRALQQAVALDLVEDGERGGGRDRVPAVRAAEPAHVHGVHELGAAGDGADRQAAAERLAP